jgi:penicillin-binding protein 2
MREMKASRIRYQIFVGLVLAVLTLLSLRLVELQLVETEIYAGESRKNTVRPRVSRPARGIIFDRKGVLLVDNQPTYSLMVTPRYFERANVSFLAELLQLPDSVVDARLREARDWSAYLPSPLFQEIPFPLFSHVQENLYRLPGIETRIDQKRRYHRGVNGTHIYGYVNEISKQQLEARRDDGYRLGDPFGQTGLERAYEDALHGRPGTRFMMVNVHGQDVKPYRNGSEDIPAQSGHTLVLSIDAELQRLAEELFVNKRGAAVALDPRNGEILAMVSSPDINPALLAGSVDREIWQGLQSDPHHPLFNRATMSGQPPGSTFKPFMALTALQDGVITENTSITCTGAYYFGRAFKCFGGAHGPLTVRDAIKRSCNVFFFTVMMRQDFQRWSDWGHTFGFGQTMPTDLPEQVPGLFPDSAYFDRAYPDGWTRGYLVSLGIGQGDMVITPLQLARYVSAVANGGTLYPPHIVRNIVDTSTGQAVDMALPEPEQIPVDPHYFDVVREGMRRMVMENNSTVKWGDVQLGGKTGTAQNPHGKDHAWFMGFGPFEDPRIAVAVLVENGGFGASVSAPIAGLMMEQYLTGDTSQHPPWVHAMARDRASEGMEDGSGMVWRNLGTRYSENGTEPTETEPVGTD